MSVNLSVSLKLGVGECLRGESVFFECAVKNEGPNGLEGLVPLTGAAHPLTLAAIPAEAKPRVNEHGVTFFPGERSGNAMSLAEREGRHEHGPEEQAEGTLRAGASWKNTGDVLRWIGEIPPGSYSMVARYNSGYEIVTSKPVPLRVHDIRPANQATARHGERVVGAPCSAAFVHQEGEAFVIFYQQQSDALGRTPLRGLRVATGAKPAELRPASIAGTTCPNGHLFWQDDGKWTGATVPLEGAPAKFAPLAPPFAGGVLRSPLSLADGGAMVPFASTSGDKAALVRIMPDGAAAAPVEINLDKGGAIGPYACCWQQETAMHLVWANKGGREVWHAATPFLDPAALPHTHSVFVANEPVLWLDAWIDGDSMTGIRPMFKETGGEMEGAANRTVPLMLKIWSVTARPKSLVCTEYSLGDMRSKPTVVFDIGDIGSLEVFESVVRSDGNIALLASDKSGAVYFASTGSRRFAPLAKLVGAAITRAQMPVLFAASRRGTLPWLYVRSLDAANSRLLFHKVEPFGEDEPSDHGHAH